jgi:hypothetical protein
LRSRLIAGAAAGVAVAGLSIATVTASASVAPAAHRPTAAQARAALVKNMVRDVAIHAPRTPGASTTLENSFNWAGYADLSGTSQEFTKVSSTWVAPKLASCSSEDRVVIDWVGLDGWTNGTVEQAGTYAQCFEGSPFYGVWWEMYPTNNIQIAGGLTPGDSVTGSVVRKGTAYTLAVVDHTHSSDSFTQNTTCALTTCLDTSAEWIQERPGYSIGLAPEAQTNAVKFTKASETGGGTTGNITSFPSVLQINCIDATGSYNIAQPGSVTTGNTFTATWKVAW